MYILGKGQKRAIDMMKFETENNQTIFSFLAFYWAILADLDIESEMFV